MEAALKLKPVAEELVQLSRKQRQGKNRSDLKLVWENPDLSTGKHREKSKVKLKLVSGQTLYTYVGGNPLSFFDLYGLAKGGKQNIHDSGLSGLSDAEVSAKARDPNISKEERRKAQKEEKARKQRNKVKRGKISNLGKIKGFGPTIAGPLVCEIMGPSPFNPFCLPEPLPNCEI